MGMRPTVSVAFSWRGIDHFAQCYDTCRASINTQSTASANIIIDDEYCVVSWIQPGKICIYRFVDSFHGNVMNAFPRAYIYAAFALDAFRLVNVYKLLRFNSCSQIIGVHSL